MGSNDGDSCSDEQPVHSVTLSPFYIGKYEVTQEEWEAVMGTNPSYFKDAKRPVEQVSWEDCQEFIRKLNEMTGMTFRLPTEAEWEYAARGGYYHDDYKYAGGIGVDAVAVYDGNSGSKTHVVGTKSPNGLGLYDMSGNVWEWCQDCYYDNYYSNSPQQDPCNEIGTEHVIRGGAWSEEAFYCRASTRSSYMPTSQFHFLGLRLAQDIACEE